MVLFVLGVLLLGASAGAQVAAAQTPAPVSVSGAVTREEATLVSEAYIALAGGDIGTAVQRAVRVRQQFPRSANALMLGVEVDIASAGGVAALDGYEQWLGGRLPEQPLALRRIAAAILADAANTPQDGSLRRAALLALAEDGSADAAAALRAGAVAGVTGDTVALASAGDEQAVARVAEALSAQVPNKIALVKALAQGGQRSAIPALASMLDDDRPEHQAAAAEALGELGARDQIPQLRALLKTSNAPQYLTMAAAGALLRMDDESGIEQLRAWMKSPVPAMRVAAAKVLGPDRDPAWTSTVRELTSDSDAMVRLEAATILAPVDADGARAAFSSLAGDADPTVRAMAARAQVGAMPADLSELRAFLRAAGDVRVSAARRILELTR